MFVTLTFLLDVLRKPPPSGSSLFMANWLKKGSAKVENEDVKVKEENRVKVKKENAEKDTKDEN